MGLPVTAAQLLVIEVLTAAFGHGVGKDCGRPRFALLGPVASQVIPLLVGALVHVVSSDVFISVVSGLPVGLSARKKKPQTFHSCHFSAKVHVRLISLLGSACPLP